MLPAWRAAQSGAGHRWLGDCSAQAGPGEASAHGGPWGVLSAPLGAESPHCLLWVQALLASLCPGHPAGLIVPPAPPQ